MSKALRFRDARRDLNRHGLAQVALSSAARHCIFHPSSRPQQVFPIAPYAPPVLPQDVQIELELATVETFGTIGGGTEGSVGSFQVRFMLSTVDGAHGLSRGRVCCVTVGLVWTFPIQIKIVSPPS